VPERVEDELRRCGADQFDVIANLVVACLLRSEWILNAMNRFGLSEDDVEITTDKQVFLSALRPFPEDYEIMKRAVEIAEEFTLQLDNGKTLIYLASVASEFDIYHAFAHAYVYKLLGMRVRGAVNFLPIACGDKAKKDISAYLLGAVANVANILSDILADLPARKILGEGYWSGAVEHMKTTYELMMTPEHLRVWALVPELYAWALHLIEAVYLGEKSLQREIRAIRAYAEHTSLETAVGLLNTLVEVGVEGFGLDIETEIEEKERVKEYILRVKFAVLCG